MDELRVSRSDAPLKRLGPPEVDPESLRALPRGSLGREYLELLDANGLVPFRLSGSVPTPVVERNLFVARYSLVHDVFHVIMGLDTSWAGEGCGRSSRPRGTRRVTGPKGARRRCRWGGLTDTIVSRPTPA